MLKELIPQVRRLFSSKNNGGKLVCSTTDRLHYYKQILIATSIALLLGYSQFRVNFQCEARDGLDPNFITQFCWINGTTTIVAKSKYNGHSPHVGIQFKSDEGDEIILHNYMRSMWAVLIIMAICSYLSQRQWSMIFDNDTLKALLKLPGYEDLSQVKIAQENKPCEKLLKLPVKRMMNSEFNRKSNFDAKLVDNHPFLSIEIFTGEQNEYNHALDYYSNQIIYLLLALNTATYKISRLNLRRLLLYHSICSFLLTLTQFLLPLLFIGKEYIGYGWVYFKEWLLYQISSLQGLDYNVNSIDYTISARIFPTLAQCPYRSFSHSNFNQVYIKCSIPINEICSKIFVVIWWFLVFNLIVEFYSMIKIILSATSFSANRWILGKCYWPKVREQAKTIVTFRYYRAMLIEHLDNQLMDDRQTSSELCDIELADNPNYNSSNKRPWNKTNFPINGEGHRKAIEAGHHNNVWSFCSSGNASLSKTEQSKQHLRLRKRTRRDGSGFRETREDFNIYYLLYLLALRMKGSRKKTGHVIGRTSEALAVYLQTQAEFVASQGQDRRRDLAPGGAELAAKVEKMDQAKADRLNEGHKKMIQANNSSMKSESL